MAQPEPHDYCFNCLSKSSNGVISSRADSRAKRFYSPSVPLNPTSQYLVDAIEALTSLDGRFENIKLVNYDSVSDAQRGCFSLVFRALDTTSGQLVALKFYDPAMVMDRYRRDCFQREFEILHSLRRAEGCLQLASGLNEYQLSVISAAGPTVTFPCQYFAVEWIADEIDHYFLRQESFDAVEKLKLFSAIVRAVHALHRQEVFHRDLKPDNLRQHTIHRDRLVVPIDMGAAAKADAPNIAMTYSRSVGAPGYAAPEARGGLAGDRLIARYTDYYALGCMLFELFNSDYYFMAHERLNPNAHMLLAALTSALDPRSDNEQRRKQWCGAMDRFNKAFVVVPIDGAGSNVPPGIAQLLSDLVRSLTHVDYRSRPKDIDWVQRRLSSCVKVLQNERLYRKRLQEAREERARRIERAAAKEARLQLNLARLMRLPC